MPTKDYNSNSQRDRFNKEVSSKIASDPHRGKSGYLDRSMFDGFGQNLKRNTVGTAKFLGNVLGPDREAWGNIFSGDASRKDVLSAGLDATVLLPAVGAVGKGAFKTAHRLGGAKYANVSKTDQVTDAIKARTAADEKLAAAATNKGKKPQVGPAPKAPGTAPKNKNSKQYKEWQKRNEAYKAHKANESKLKDWDKNNASRADARKNARAAEQGVAEAEAAERIKLAVERSQSIRKAVLGKNARVSPDFDDVNKVMNSWHWDNPLGRAAQKADARLAKWNESTSVGKDIAETLLGFNRGGVGSIFSNSAAGLGARGVPLVARNINKNYIRGEAEADQLTDEDAVFSPDGRYVEVVLPDGSLSEPIPTSIYRTHFENSGGDKAATAAAIAKLISLRSTGWAPAGSR